MHNDKIQIISSKINQNKYTLAWLVLAFSFLRPHFDMILSWFIQYPLHIQLPPGRTRFSKQALSIFTTLTLLIYITKVAKFFRPCKFEFLPTNINDLEKVNGIQTLYQMYTNSHTYDTQNAAKWSNTLHYPHQLDKIKL